MYSQGARPMQLPAQTCRTCRSSLCPFSHRVSGQSGSASGWRLLSQLPQHQPICAGATDGTPPAASPQVRVRVRHRAGTVSSPQPALPQVDTTQAASGLQSSGAISSGLLAAQGPPLAVVAHPGPVHGKTGSNSSVEAPYCTVGSTEAGTAANAGPLFSGPRAAAANTTVRPVDRPSSSSVPATAAATNAGLGPAAAQPRPIHPLRVRQRCKMYQRIKATAATSDGSGHTHSSAPTEAAPPSSNLQQVQQHACAAVGHASGQEGSPSTRANTPATAADGPSGPGTERGPAGVHAAGPIQPVRTRRRIRKADNTINAVAAALDSEAPPLEVNHSGMTAQASLPAPLLHHHQPCVVVPEGSLTTASSTPAAAAAAGSGSGAAAEQVPEVAQASSQGGAAHPRVRLLPVRMRQGRKYDDIVKAVAAAPRGTAAKRAQGGSSAPAQEPLLPLLQQQQQELLLHSLAGTQVMPPASHDDGASGGGSSSDDRASSSALASTSGGGSSAAAGIAGGTRAAQRRVQAAVGAAIGATIAKAPGSFGGAELSPAAHAHNLLVPPSPLLVDAAAHSAAGLSQLAPNPPVMHHEPEAAAGGSVLTGGQLAGSSRRHGKPLPDLDPVLLALASLEVTADKESAAHARRGASWQNWFLQFQGPLRAVPTAPKQHAPASSRKAASAVSPNVPAAGAAGSSMDEDGARVRAGGSGDGDWQLSPEQLGEAVPQGPHVPARRGRKPGHWQAPLSSKAMPQTALSPEEMEAREREYEAEREQEKSKWLFCVREDESEGEGGSVVYGLPYHPDVTHMDEATWQALSDEYKRRALVCALPPPRSRGGGGFTFNVHGTRAGPWRSFVMRVEGDFALRDVHTRFPNRLACGERVRHNARNLSDLVAFLADPVEEVVGEHLANIARLREGRLTPTSCFRLLWQCYGVEGLAAVGWTRERILQHINAVRQKDGLGTG